MVIRYGTYFSNVFRCCLVESSLGVFTLVGVWRYLCYVDCVRFFFRSIRFVWYFLPKFLSVEPLFVCLGGHLFDTIGLVSCFFLPLPRYLIPFLFTERSILPTSTFFSFFYRALQFVHSRIIDLVCLFVLFGVSSF